MASQFPDASFTADSILPQRETHLESAEINKCGRLEVAIDGEVLQFPVDWLRQNCQCVKCFNPICLSFISPLKNIIDVDLSLQSVEVCKEGVRCVFSDAHEAVFVSDWLYNRRMTKEGNKERSVHIFVHHRAPWPTPEDVKVEKASYQEVTEMDSGFERFAEALMRDGIFVITNGPIGLASDDFAQRTGLVPAHNHYNGNGSAYWLVRNDPSPTNHAFTNVELELHVDQPYLKGILDIQYLHCMVQSKEGGENVMSDVIKAARVLREKNPDYYKLLTTFTVQHEDVISHQDQENHHYMANCKPTIIVDDEGEPLSAAWCNPAHSSFFPGTVDEYERYIQALKAFYKTLYDCSITLKSSPGDIMVFDNQRVMHGRRGFPSSESRSLEGWYSDWDSIYSKLRVIKIKKGAKVQM